MFKIGPHAEHSSTSCKAGQGVPPHDAGVMTVLTLSLTPSTQAVQGPHSDTTQLTGVQHSLVSTSGGHAVPPFCGCCITVLVLVSTPSIHGPQALHSDTTQLITGGVPSQQSQSLAAII